MGGPLNFVKSIFSGPKKPDIPAPLPVATRDDAAAQVAQDDAIRRRRGTAANMLVAAGSGEAAAGATATKTLTGQ